VTIVARSPLFDIYDPYGLLQQQAELGLLPPSDEDLDVVGIAPLGQQRATIADLMPREDRNSLLSGLASVGSSGLAAAGWLLDTPGALVRGVLAGKPLSVFGSSEDRVTGRELLRQYGMVGDEDTWGNFGTGLAAELLLDPLTYLNPFAALGKGALTKAAGEPLKKAGLLRDAALDAARGYSVADNASRAVDDVLIQGDTVPRIAGPVDDPARFRRDPSGVREYLRNLTPEQAFREAKDRLTPEEYGDALKRFQAAGGDMNAKAAGLMSFKVPWTGVQYDISGGALGDSIASGLDAFGEWSKRAPVIGPVGRAAAMAFYPDVGYTLNPDVQMANRQAKAVGRRNAERFRTQMMKLERGAREASVPEFAEIGGQQIPIPQELRGFTPQVQNAIVDWIESGGPDASSQALSVLGSPSIQRSSGDELADWVLNNVPEFTQMRDSLASLGPSAIQAARSRALKMPSWHSRLSNTNFFPRQILWFDRDLPPSGTTGKVERPYSRGERLLSTADNFGRARQLYTDLEGGRRTFRELTAGPDARTLQSDLLAANNIEARKIIDNWFASRGRALPYQKLVDDAAAAGGDVEQAARLADSLKDQLSDLLRTADTQYADKGVGIFDTPAFSDALRYGMGQARVSADADELISQLVRNAADTPAEAVTGGTSIPLSKAAEDLGFDVDQFKKLFNERSGSDITNFSIDKRLAQSLGVLAQGTRLGLPESAAMNALNSYSRIWKAGALAWPSFHTRNAYSNVAASAAAGAWDPMSLIQGYRASKGNYAPVAAALRDAPIYRDLPDDAARAQRFLEDSSTAGVGFGSIFDEAGVPEQSIAGLYPGASGENNIAAAAKELLLGKEGRTWGEYARDFGTVKGVGISRPAKRTNNPILKLNDAVGGTVEDASRVGMLINLLKKGYDPAQAGDMIRMALVDYSPEAFTAIERDLFKNLAPFYSFQKGIIPSIVDNLLYRPGGLQGQGIRAVTRAGEPGGDTFVPEDLRKSAAIPLPRGLPAILGGTPKEGLQRYLNKIDMPWEAFFNTMSPGVGATTTAAIADTAKKTGSNLLGMLNPLLKVPIEYATNRQLYSGRELTDLYSVLERDLGQIGKPLENIISGLVPGGTRALGVYRQLTDDRLDPLDKYTKFTFNTLSGSALTDRDIEQSKRRAARDILNKMLSTTPGVRTYENITVPEDVLRAMPKEQRDLYLLYKVIQSEASERARDKKKQQAALDPLQMLGVLNQF
jgi:hypothetical protein